MYRPPDWQPLERALSAHFGPAAADVTASFWFIGFAPGPDDVGELRQYEHCRSHRRLVLDRDGRAYGWFAEIDGFSRVSSEDAIVAALG